MKNVEAMIKEFISKKSFIPVEELASDVSLNDSSVLSSLGFLELIVSIEGNFGISISSDELVSENYKTISALSTFVEEKMAKNGSANA